MLHTERGSVTQLIKDVVSCRRVPTGGNKPMLISSLLHPTSLYVLDQSNLGTSFSKD